MEGAEKDLWTHRRKDTAKGSNIECTLYGQGIYEATRSKQQECWELRKVSLGENHHDRLPSLIDLAAHYQEPADSPITEEINRIAVNISGQILGESHSDTMESISRLDGGVDKSRKHAEAE